MCVRLAYQSADDIAVWYCAAANGLMIISKDQDFRQRALLFGPPPKCVRIRLGNCTTSEIASLLKHRAALLREFQKSEACLLILDARNATMI